MKKCAYCAKEISYSEMYCCEECEKLANEYYRLRMEHRTPLNIAYIGGSILMGIGIFVYAFAPAVGAFMVAVSGLLMGLITIFIPTPSEGMVYKNKLKKAMDRIKIFGVILTAMGTAATVLGFLHILLW